MAEFLSLEPEVDQDKNMVSEEEGLEECNKVNLDLFIDESIQKNGNPSEYYGFTNVTWTCSSAEELIWRRCGSEQLLCKSRYVL